MTFLNPMAFLSVMLLLFLVLDVILLVTLLRPGDERNQRIVGKAAVFTLFGTSGAVLLQIAENILHTQPLSLNPLVHLQTTAILYFFSLLYYKRKLGG